MTKIKIKLNDNFEKEFKEIVKKEYGREKRDLSKAVEEAMKKWIHEHKSVNIPR